MDAITEIDYNGPAPVVTERPLTTDEIAQREADAVAEVARQQAETDRIAAREAAIAKWTALGFTLDDLAALGL